MRFSKNRRRDELFVALAGVTAGYYDSENIYKAISYDFYESKMDEQVRQEKKQGWNEAVQMLLK